MGHGGVRHVGGHEALFSPAVDGPYPVQEAEYDASYDEQEEDSCSCSCCDHVEAAVAMR